MILTIINYILGIIAFILLAWPFPAFLMSREGSEKYFDFIFRNKTEDPSRFAALPFVWGFISVPISVILFVILTIY